MLLDSSAFIDGRINSFSQTGFLDAPLVAPQFIIDELHQLSDSNDSAKRARGRRGLANLRQLQDNARTTITIEQAEQGDEAVDLALLLLAEEKSFRIVTTDFNLARVAEIRDVSVLNLNDLTDQLQGTVVPGQTMPIAILRKGESKDQGIGFLPDGTMVVIEGGDRYIGDEIMITINNSVQTTAGRLVFARPADDMTHEESTKGSMASSAVDQARQTTSPQNKRPGSGRSPRRG